jgi:peptide/nickel transport system permease protein
MNGRLGVALAIAWLGAILVFALLAPLLSTHDPFQPVAAPLNGPSLSMPLGSDALGRDVWSRLAYGARLTLAAATLSTTLTVVIGSVLGLAAAASGGWTDRTIVAAANATLAIPGLVLAMLIVAAIGPSLTAVVLAVGLGAVPGFARLARTTFLQVRERAYVTASGALGAGRWWRARHHLLPNAWPSLASLTTTHFAWALLGITTLTFLGLAGDPSLPEWGAMLNSGRQHLLDAPRLALLPGLAIALTVIAVHRLGDRSAAGGSSG